MSTEIAILPPSNLLPTQNEWGFMLDMAGALVASGLLPSHVKTREAAVAIMLKGKELGVPPMYAFSNIAVINGKPTAQAELMLALIYRDHGDDAIHITVSTATICTVSAKRRGWPGRRSMSFTIEEAEAAGLFRNPVWKTYPAAMLRARCLSLVARAVFPDSIGGMYTPEEIGGQVRVTQDGEVTLAEVAPHEPTGPRAVNRATGEVSDPLAPPLAFALADAFSSLVIDESLDLGDLGPLPETAHVREASDWLCSVLLVVIGLSQDETVPSAETLADLTRLYAEYRQAGVKLKTPKGLSGGSATWLVKTLAGVLHATNDDEESPL